MRKNNKGSSTSISAFSSSKATVSTLNPNTHREVDQLMKERARLKKGISIQEKKNNQIL